jgi:DNA-binding SARP family transcriptional activator
MRVRLLGSVDICIDGEARPVSGLRRKAVLAVLALQPGRIVSTDRLVEVVWDGTAPATAVNTLQSHISHLRQVFADRTAIVARHPGYVLDLGPETTDLQLAERLVRQAGGESGLEKVRLLREALALWRGRALVDVAGVALLDEQAERLDEFRQDARQALIQARLELGEHAQLVPELELLARERPFDERLHAQLLLALYRSGRQADALATYQRLRRSLDEELGIDPSPPLRELEAAILRQDAVLDLPAADQHAAAGQGAGAGSGVRAALLAAAELVLPEADQAPRPHHAVPRQLPPSVPAFVGREAELAILDALLLGAPANGPGAVVISAISGTAGIGKTALAIHWGHRVAQHFPDGQLYVNLRGFDPTGAATEPAEALRVFLGALGVPAQQIPVEVDARAALYRSLLAGRRALVVLDNARDAEQVRPLLPGAAGCLVMVTSRNQLGPLVVTEGAYPLSVDLLPAADAEGFLARRLGAQRVADEPAATREIVVRCARLPLALAVAAARAVSRPNMPLRVLAGELRQATLDGFDGGDAASDVRSVLSWSYHALSDGAARLFRLLGVHPGPDVSLAAAASVAGLAIREARPLLGELTRAHLLTEHLQGRYSWHDLLRAYAAESVAGDPERAKAARRALDHYLHTSERAAVLRYPERDPIELVPLSEGASAARLADRDAALAWYLTEHPVLLAIFDLAAAEGLDTHSWQLARNLVNYLDGQGNWPELVAVQEAALAAATRLGDRSAQARIHRLVARGHTRLGQHARTQAHIQQALRLYAELDDQVGQGYCHQMLVRTWIDQQRYKRALEHALAAYQLFCHVGHRVGEGRLLNAIGWCHSQLGDYQRGLDYCARSLRLQEEIGDRVAVADTLDSLGYAHHHLGDHDEAIECYQRALEMHLDLGDRYREAQLLTHLGDAQHDAGHPDAARTWASALVILEDLKHAEAGYLRAKLRRLEQAPTGGAHAVSV